MSSFFTNAKRAFGSKSAEDYEDDRDYDYEDEDFEEKKPFKSLFSFISGRRDEDFEDDYEDDEEDSVSERTTGRRSSFYSSSSSGERYSSSGSRYGSSQNKSQIRYNPASSNTEVILVTLTDFDDSEKIVKEIKNGKITIFDVSEIESNEAARRVVDYISGAAAGMECPFSRLCHGIFCIAPKGVTITAKKSRYM